MVSALEANFNLLLVSGYTINLKLRQLEGCKPIKQIHISSNHGRIIAEIWISCEEKNYVLDAIKNLLLLGSIIRIGTLDGNTYPGYLLPTFNTFPDPILQGKIKIQSPRNIQEIEQIVKSKIAWKVIYKKKDTIIYLAENTPTSWFFKKGIRITRPYYSPPKLLNTNLKTNFQKYSPKNF